MPAAFSVSGDKRLLQGDEPVLQRPTSHCEGRFARGRPDFVIIHYTAGATAEDAIRLFLSGTPRVSAHIVLDRDGSATQMVDLDTIAWHAGASEWGGLTSLNKVSAGIEITNWGWLTGEPGAWKSWNGTAVPDSAVFIAPQPDSEGRIAWEKFEPVQLAAARDITRALMAAFGIPAANVLGHEEISPGRKQDPGPALGMDAFRASL